MDELIQVIESIEEIQFLVSLDYSTPEFGNQNLYSCEQWASLYAELGDYGNNPLIIDSDPNHKIWEMFAGTTYSAYAMIDHNMVLRYKFDMPNLYDFQYTYLPNLVDSMYGCIDEDACNFSNSAVYDNGTCIFDEECLNCDNYTTQLSCIENEDCLWMGDHCMESNNNCMGNENQASCLNESGCFWMGDHCMPGSNCTDPVALNYNPIADELNDNQNLYCDYSPYLIYGCTYENAINFNQNANIDDGSCEHELVDINNDGILDILDIVTIVNFIING